MMFGRTRLAIHRLDKGISHFGTALVLSSVDLRPLKSRIPQSKVPLFGMVEGMYIQLPCPRLLLMSTSMTDVKNSE